DFNPQNFTTTNYMQTLTNCPVCKSTQFSSFIKTKAQMHSHTAKETFNFDQCAGCQLVFLNPRVPLKELTNYYTDYYLPYRGAKAWGKYESLVANSQAKTDAKRVELVQKYRPLSSNDLVLDVGCGQPSFLQACLQATNCQGMGIDFSDEGWTGKNAEYQQLNLQVGEVKDLPTNIQPDVITMWHYLEHDYTPLANLKELRKRTKKDTTLIIEVPNFASESRQQFGKDWAGWHTPRHTSLFSPENIKLLLENSGWQAETVLTYGTLDPYVLYWMSKMEQKGIAWNKNMEEEFVNFVWGMVTFLPKKWQQKKRPLGVMTAIAKPC
ncbi:MAG: class I SAM-dependent methyltransferase, partial [Bacteroidota bacterium]